MLPRKIDNLVIIQARMTSSRLPQKVLLSLEGKTVLEHVVERVNCAKNVDDVVVATTIGRECMPIVRLCAEKGIRVFCGSEDDVLDRYYQVARLLKPKNVIRITSDCPMIDPNIIDEIVKKHIDMGNDYTSNVLEDTFPDGLDCEVMKFSVLEMVWKQAKLLSEREHVTLYIRNNTKQFKCHSVIDEIDHQNYRWTLDEECDYEFISQIYKELYSNNKIFTSENVYRLLEQKPELMKINCNIVRNEGMLKSLKNDKMVEKGLNSEK